MKQLHNLTPPELILLQKHIELGEEHLIKILGEKNFNDFLRWTKTKQEGVEQIEADDTELSGNLILTLNTIITGCFGGWMGLSAVMGLNLHAPLAFGTVFTLAAALGAFIGYQNFESTKMDAIQNIHALQMVQFEMDILKRIRQIREQELQEIETELFTFSPSMKKTSFRDWFMGFEQTLEEELTPYRGHLIYHLLAAEIKGLKEEVKQNFEAIFPQKMNTKFLNPTVEHTPRNLPAFIKVMISSPPTVAASPEPWIQKNARKILISLIPTLAGGFGSMFVYLSGTTDIAKAFEYHQLVSLLTSPSAKYVKLAIALLFTAYFGFSSLYSNRKAYKRSREIEKNEELISKEESSLTLIDEQLFKLRKIREDVNKIRKLFQITEEKIEV